MHVIENLRAAARHCLSHEDDRLRWLGQSLNDFLAHRYRSVDEALGLRFPRGGVPWWREEAMRVRNAALLELASRHLYDLPVTAQARRLYLLSRRYEASAWRHDRQNQAMPPHYAGTPNEWLWRAFTSGAPMPLRERQLRNILPKTGSASDVGNGVTGPGSSG
jgi:hypothetical protein